MEILALPGHVAIVAVEYVADEQAVQHPSAHGRMIEPA
jgi:hypothetical protein